MKARRSDYFQSCETRCREITLQPAAFLGAHFHVHTAPSSGLVQLGHVGTHTTGGPPENKVCGSYGSFEI